MRNTPAHYAGLDTRVNAGWPHLRDAHLPGVKHRFHNDTTPHYGETAARRSKERTLAFFRATLG